MAYINIGELTEEVNDIKAHIVVEFQAPTSANGYTWYRKYADGWVEQGGFATLPAQAASTLAAASSSLPVIMLDTNYSVNWIQAYDAGNSHELTQVSINRTTTSLNINFYSLAATTGGNIIGWEVSGMAAA